jgi:hydroxymethylbilane synthase
MPDTPLIRIGTHSSPMALAQAERVRAELAARRPDLVTEAVPFTTSGDRLAGPLSAPGGKGGAFTKETRRCLDRRAM